MRLSKIQNLPEKTKKAILWFVVGAMGLVFFSIWISNIGKTFSGLSERKIDQELGIPSFQGEFEEFTEFKGQIEELKGMIEESIENVTPVQ